MGKGRLNSERSWITSIPSRETTNRSFRSPGSRSSLNHPLWPNWSRPRRRGTRAERWVILPALLFAATCASTFVGYFLFDYGGSASDAVRSVPGVHALREAAHDSLIYACCVMLILGCHEAGHFVQARRYRIHASYPYFIPMPLTPIGTMGAVIVMEAGVGDRKALFDVGITGPLAGLVPTILCCYFGMQHSELIQVPAGSQGWSFGEPLIFRWMSDLVVGPRPAGYDLGIQPVAFAGWVGLFITSLNLFPIGQLDGGHVLYGLLRRKAHGVAWLLVTGALAAVAVATLVFHQWNVAGWTVMLTLLFIMGPRHPPTADDNVPLGPVRIILGWLTLAFLPLGFTPMPFST